MIAERVLECNPVRQEVLFPVTENTNLFLYHYQFSAHTSIYYLEVNASIIHSRKRIQRAEKVSTIAINTSTHTANHHFRMTKQPINAILNKKDERE